MKPIIEVKKLYKRYQYGQNQPYLTLRESVIHAMKAPFRFIKSDNIPKNEFWALKNVSFNISPGESIGIIGRNGAGKSTLLKLLSRITPPTRGEIILRGRVASLLEIGTGFHQELTGRENIFLNGSILGMTQKEIKSKFDEIVDFAEIETFLDTPVKFYSSGMYMRLAFAVAAHLDSEILLVDEVLAVGDTAFQKKCLGKMENVAKQGRTVIFVSHNMGSIKQLCSKCFLIDKGSLVDYDNTDKIVAKYLDSVITKDSRKAEKYFLENKDKEFQLLSVRLLDDVGKVTQNFDCDKHINIELTCLSRVSLPGLYGYLRFSNKEGIPVLTSYTSDLLPNCLDSLKPGKYKIMVNIPPRILGHGEYSIYIVFHCLQSNKSFYVDDPEYVCNFSLNDYTSEIGNTRDGYLSTLIKWDIKK